MIGGVNMNDIRLTRGDTLHLEVEIINQDGEPYELEEGDKLEFTLKKNTATEEVLIKKEILEKKFTISHEESQKLSYGLYVYDVQLTQANGDVTTIIKPSTFDVTEEVNFD